MVFLHRTLGRPLGQSETPLRQSGRLFSRCAGFFRQSDSCRAGALSAQTIPTVARATPTVQPARHLRVPTTRSTRPLSRTPIPGFPAQTPSIRQESDGNPGIQVQMVAQARQVTDTRATSDGRTGGQHSNGPTIHSVDSTHPANPAHPGNLAAQRIPTRVTWPPSEPLRSAHPVVAPQTHRASGDSLRSRNDAPLKSP